MDASKKQNKRSKKKIETDNPLHYDGEAFKKYLDLKVTDCFPDGTPRSEVMGELKTSDTRVGKFSFYNPGATGRSNCKMCMNITTGHNKICWFCDKELDRLMDRLIKRNQYATLSAFTQGYVVKCQSVFPESELVKTNPYYKGSYAWKEWEKGFAQVEIDERERRKNVTES